MGQKANLKKSLLIGFSVVLWSSVSTVAQAAALFQDDDFEFIRSDGIVIDETADASGDLIIQFGGILNETIRWESANSRFTVSDDLRIEGNAAVVGQGFIASDHAATDSDGFLNLGRNSGAWELFSWNSSTLRFDLSDDLSITGGLVVTDNIDVNLNELLEVRVENLASEPTCDAGGTGRLYFNTTTDHLSFCDGAVWSAAAPLVIGQVYDSTGGTDVDVTTAVPIPFDAETRKDTGVTHSTTVNNSRVTLDNAGWYRVSYSVTHSNATLTVGNIHCNIRLNGTTTVIPSDSYAVDTTAFTSRATNSGTAIFQTAGANEYYEVMCKNNGLAILGSLNTTANESWTLVEKL